MKTFEVWKNAVRLGTIEADDEKDARKCFREREQLRSTRGCVFNELLCSCGPRTPPRTVCPSCGLDADDHERWCAWNVSADCSIHGKLARTHVEAHKLARVR